ncbi:MAG: hypothetical protein QGD90_00190 [Candidatus Hydrogenedentes bacterium]|nr:hypothetical protein [Candidatus Hydrogenedentota bacterium]
MIIIPVRAVAEYSIDVDLDARPFTMIFKWNFRGQYWTVEFTTREDVLIHGAIKVVPDYDLLHNTRHIAALPQGILMIVDTTESGDPIVFADLGERLQLVYTPEADLAEL